MNHKIVLVSAALLLAITAHASQPLEDSIQERIVADYLYARGFENRTADPNGSAVHGGEPSHKCGMSAVADYVMYRDRLDPGRHALLEASVPSRYSLSDSFVSPTGRFLIHYTKTGSDAVYQSTIDSDGDGVPNYVESVATICDSVYDYIITTLGYPAPPSDGFYPSGGTAAYDIYLRQLSAGFFGLAFPDSLNFDLGDIQKATSFIELDNDYQSISRYRNRPLDAVRVTVAHEFFHAVQFGIDISEAVDVQNGPLRRHWMEATAVWMEEEIYDEVNDHYTYLDTFYINPRVSLQRFNSSTDLHPYSAVVFPLFLAEKYGRDIIREIWLRCKTLGLGGNAYTAISQAIGEVTGGAETFATAMTEFSVWNYFTGPYAQFAPAGIGFEEGANFPAIPAAAIRSFDTLPVSVTFQTNALKPEFNGASYYRFENLGYRMTDVEYCFDSVCAGWRYTDSIFNGTIWVYQDSLCQRWNCTDSVLVGQDWVCTDSVLVANWLCIDRAEALWLQLPLAASVSTWCIAYINQSRSDLRRVDISSEIVTGSLAYTKRFRNPDSIYSLTVIAVPASTDQSRYQSNVGVDVGYFLRFDTTDLSLLPPNKPAAILTPYPNPAEISSMNGEPVRFRFQIPTVDSLSLPQTYTPLLLIDLYTVGGDFVRQVPGVFTDGVDRLDIYRNGLFEAEWDMKNSDGDPVVSGVYLAYARLYNGSSKSALLAEDHVKLLVVR